MRYKRTILVKTDAKNTGQRNENGWNNGVTNARQFRQGINGGENASESMTFTSQRQDGIEGATVRLHRTISDNEGVSVSESERIARHGR